MFVTDAAYGPDSRPVCSICWSQLDFDWGKGFRGDKNVYLTGEDAQGGKGEDYIDANKEPWLVWATPYRCMNPDCDAGALVRTLPAKLTFGIPWHPDDIEALSIDDELYSTGEYDEFGVFWVEEDGEWFHVSTEDADATEITVEFVPPWVYINPGSRLREEAEKQHWTFIDGRIKVNRDSERLNKIRKWFADRGVGFSIPHPTEETEEE